MICYGITWSWGPASIPQYAVGVAALVLLMHTRSLWAHFSGPVNVIVAAIVPLLLAWTVRRLRIFIRGLHLGVLGTVVLVVLTFVTADLEPTGTGPIAGTAVGLFFALLVLYGSVILFNRPRRVVPPHARIQPGAMHEWRARLRERGQ